MSSKVPEYTAPPEPALPPEPVESELLEFRDDPTYRIFLDVVHLENTSLLLVADLMADVRLARHFGPGLKDRLLHIARWLDQVRGTTSDTGRIDEDGEITRFPGTHEYSVRQKQAMVGIAMLTSINVMLANREVTEALRSPWRERLLNRIGYLRNAILISQREATGYYALVLRDIAGQPSKHSPWEN